MKYGVVDIGSNSVRLMINDNGKTLYKKVKITKLALGMKDGILHNEAVERTVRAVSFFVKYAREIGVDKIFAFATAAVRNARNKKTFLDLVYDACGVNLDVVDGEKESQLGALGALGGKDGGIIDVGGASTEIAVVVNGEIAYSKSVEVGAVKLTNVSGQDYDNARNFASPIINAFGIVPIKNFYGIGGTATTVSAMLQKLKEYNPQLIDGSTVTLLQLEQLTQKLYELSVEDRKKLAGLQPERADVIANGCCILLQVMKHLNIDRITISEKDNLEGYLITKMGTL